MSPIARGFSLVEILVVLAIVAAALAVVTPALTSGRGAALESAAHGVAGVLRTARDRAIGSAAEQVVSVDVDRREIVSAGARRTLPGTLTVTLFTARSERSAAAAGRIRFFPDGSATGGRVTLADGDARMAVDVDWLTGRVRIIDDDADTRSAGPAVFQ